MRTFISKLVDTVFSKHTDYKSLVFVVPSQRACVFLKEEIILKIPQSSFLPKIVSIENYIQELADIQLIDNTQLLFEFYSVYKKNSFGGKDSFDVFSQWATIALHDFNDIDSYFVDPEALFSNLRDLKRLSKWFQNEQPSELAMKHLALFDHLYELYNGLTRSLKEHKTGYQGLIYKEAKDSLEFYMNTNKDKHIIFAGFNALNKAEEYIFQELLNHQMASVYWDIPKSFLNDSNEAGAFLRNYKKEWPYFKNHPFEWVFQDEKSDSHTQIIGVPKNVSQIKYAGELLSEMDQFENTAFILAEENLLPLALNVLPDKVRNVNITMGYPLNDIPVGILFEKLFRLQLNKDKYKDIEEEQFYYKNVLAVFNDPYLNRSFGDVLQRIIKDIKTRNSIFLRLDSIKAILTSDEVDGLSSVLAFFESYDNMDNVIIRCITLLKKLRQGVEGLDKEYLYRFYLVFQQLHTLNKKYQHITDLKTLTIFYNQVLRSEKLSFQGEPLRGLQLMGMLETRMLDFETVIITSINEGILPTANKEISFIPFDIKKHFGLPTYQERDAIFSYHFQRIIHRAKKKYLLYNSETDGFGSGEKSRFLTALEIQNSNVIKKTIAPKVEVDSMNPITIQKSIALQEGLKTVFKEGISPSALSNYILNPLKFYEQKVLGIREEDEVEETVASKTMGSVIHHVLEDLYTPFVGRFLKKENLVKMKEKLEALLELYFSKYYKKGNLKTGKNKLIFEVCRKIILSFIQHEIEVLEQGKSLKILALEKKLEKKIKIEGIDFLIKIKGVVDRVDELDGKLRIIDYKTGKVEQNQLKIPDFSIIHTDYKYTKALQVMLYAYLYKQENSSLDGNMEAGIISFRNLKSGFIKMNFSEARGGKDFDITKERITDFLEELTYIIKEILNPNQPFIENQNAPF